MPSKENELLLKFMGSAIEKINICLSSVYALEVLLIEKGFVTQEEMINRLKDSKSKPFSEVGKHVLDEMLKGSSFEGKSLYEMIDWEKTQANIKKTA